DKSITGTTICQGLRISQKTADEWLRESINRKYGPKVDKYATYRWTQNEFDALVSFAYNVGSIDGLTAQGSRTRAEISHMILAYNKAGGRELTGLTKRRQEERALFLTPVPEQVKTGWQQEDGGWRFYFRDGSGKHVVNAWYHDEDKWYWFDGAGMMVHDTWYRYNGDWYYLGTDGAMVKGLQTSGGKWYYLDDDGRMATEPVVLTPDQDGALQHPGLRQ
ncbi:lysozyme, partial [Clostridium sp. OF09-36]|uniref:lysozyme n=1 Tax=Clostridium sp. OF09-36 TaxID=2292310 RepID=UPI001FA96266